MGTSGSVSATYGYVFAALIYSAFALHLVQAGKLPKVSGLARLAFFAAVASTAAWGWSGILMQYQSGQSFALSNALFDLLRYASWFLFLLVLLQPQARSGRQRVTTLLGVIAASLFAFALLSLLTDQSGPFFGKGSSRYALYAALALPVLGLILVEQLFRNVTEDSRWNAKPLCLGLICIFAFDVYLYSEAILSSEFEDAAVGIRGAIHSLTVPFLLIASRRESNWITKLQVSRTAAFHSATTLLAGIYLIFISAVGYYVRYFGGEWGPALQIGLLFVALIVLTAIVLSGAMRAKLRVLVGKHFFSYRYDYRQEWLRFTATLSSNSSPQQVGELVIRGLADMLESPAGALWSKAPQGAELVQTATWNMPRMAERELVTTSFSRFLCERGWIISLNEYRSFPGRYEPLVVPEWLTAIPNAWLIVPLPVADQLIGFVVLARARTSVDVNWEVTDLLKTASRQAASFLAQMHATEALLEVRKFDAFNRMSAFVVHDLKNIVTQLSLMMKNAKRLRDNPEFQSDMLMTVENSLEKMRQLMLQLREGETPPGGLYGVDLVPITRSMEALAKARGRELRIDAADRLVARGHEERIERVIGHMVQNAFDATPVAGRVWLRLDRVGGQARVEIGDTGQGMSEDFIRSRLFKPFNTTKEAGMGIGAYESYQYIRELGGHISVASELQKGTTVTILLPLFDAQPESDLHTLSPR